MYGKQKGNSKIFSLNMYLYIYENYGVYMGSGRGGGADQKKKEQKKKKILFAVNACFDSQVSARCPLATCFVVLSFRNFNYVAYDIFVDVPNS